MFAHNPLHGSGQAGFPHPALALGDDAHAAQGIGIQMVGTGSQRVMRRRMRFQSTRPLWLRRESVRCQSRPTWNRKRYNAGWFMGTP